jgi:hypothetical protein
MLVSRKFRTLPVHFPQTGLKIARQTADVEQAAQRGQTAAFRTHLELQNGKS